MISDPEFGEIDRHALGIGQIIGNLHSLELAMRLFLDRAKSGNSSAPKPDLFSLKAGDRVGVTPFTNYDSLGRVIDRYNERVAGINPELSVDKSVVELRDALAHGRLLTRVPQRPIRLFRFSAPHGTTVEVSMALDVTDEWIAEQRRRLYAEIQKVSEAADMLEHPRTAG